MNSARGAELGKTSWTVGDLTRLAAAYAAAACTLGVCWVAVSTTVRWSTQITWLAVAVGAVVVSGCGAARWLLIGFRTVRRRQQLVDERAASLERALLPSAPSERPEISAATRELVTVPGMKRYHLPTCRLVAGKTISAESERAHVAAGRQPCGVCRP